MFDDPNQRIVKWCINTAESRREALWLKISRPQEYWAPRCSSSSVSPLACKSYVGGAKDGIVTSDGKRASAEISHADYIGWRPWEVSPYSESCFRDLGGGHRLDEGSEFRTDRDNGPTGGDIVVPARHVHSRGPCRRPRPPQSLVPLFCRPARGPLC